MRNDEYLCDMNLRHPLFLSLPLLLLSGAASAQGQAQEEMNYLMVYFTLGMAGGSNGLWYAYADTAFTRLETLPQPFDVQPCVGGGIDPDITLVDGVYRMFYCLKGRIVQATCSSLTGIYNE